MRIKKYRKPVFRIQIQDFDNQKIWKKIYSWKKIYIYNWKLQSTYPYASVKDVQATGDPSALIREQSRNSMHEIFELFVGWPNSMRIRNTAVTTNKKTHQKQPYQTNFTAR